MLIKELLNEEEPEPIARLPLKKQNKIKDILEKSGNIHTKKGNKWAIKKLEEWILTTDEMIIIEEIEAEKFNEILKDFFCKWNWPRSFKSIFLQTTINKFECCIPKI